MGLRANIESRVTPFLFADRLKGDTAWPIAAFAMSAALLILFVFYHRTVTDLVETWDHSATFNHCFLIPPISLFLIWRQRHRFLATVPAPSLLGLPVVAVAALVWLVGDAASIDFAAQLAFVTMIIGMHLAIFGKEVTRINLFPLAYLFMAVPMGDFLIPHLQVVTAEAAVSLLRLFGVPVFTEGTYITIPNGTYFVAEACAGLRFLIATVTLGMLFGYLYYRSPWRWAAFMALSVVVPIIANAIRAFGIILVGFHTNTEFAGGFDHIVTGWIFLAIVTLVLLAIGYSFSDRRHEEAPEFWQRARAVSLAPAKMLSCVAAGAADRYPARRLRRLCSSDGGTAAVLALDVAAAVLDAVDARVTTREPAGCPNSSGRIPHCSRAIGSPKGSEATSCRLLHPSAPEFGVARLR